MSWCLDCHRNPQDALRPLDQITNLNWKPEQQSVPDFLAKYGKPPKQEARDFSKVTALSQEEIGLTLRDKWHINPPDKNCAGCHR